MHIRNSDNEKKNKKKKLIIIFIRKVRDNNRDNDDISSPHGKLMPEWMWTQIGFVTRMSVVASSATVPMWWYTKYNRIKINGKTLSMPSINHHHW